MTDQTTCPNCRHTPHLPGTECDTRVEHGPNCWHLCLCLARPGAALPCPPQMTCQGGTLGYADIWYLQHGHSLMSADGVISSEVLKAVSPRPAVAEPVPVDRAALLREVADECDKAGAAYTARAQNEHAGAAFALMETFLRKANEAEYVATPCDFVACEPGGEPCSTHERLMAHAEGEHELCAPECGSTAAPTP